MLRLSASALIMRLAPKLNSRAVTFCAARARYVRDATYLRKFVSRETYTGTRATIWYPILPTPGFRLMPALPIFSIHLFFVCDTKARVYPCELFVLTRHSTSEEAYFFCRGLESAHSWGSAQPSMTVSLSARRLHSWCCNPVSGCTAVIRDGQFPPQRMARTGSPAVARDFWAAGSGPLPGRLSSRSAAGSAAIPAVSRAP
jgi:hypothetical protein